MLRSTVLTVVLLFAAAPSAPLFCKAWCDPGVAARSGCHDSGAESPASLTSADACDDDVSATPMLVKEDVRRLLSPDAGPSAIVATLRVDTSSGIGRPVGHRGRAPSDRQHPLTVPLRI